MPRGMVALAGAALALVLVSAVPEPAEARRGGGPGVRSGGHVGSRIHSGARLRSGPRIRSGPRVYFRNGRHRAHRRFRHRRAHPRIFVGPPVTFYDSYYYDNGCAWLRRRALRTGSPYWWNRYYACIDYDD